MRSLLALATACALQGCGIAALFKPQDAEPLAEGIAAIAVYAQEYDQTYGHQIEFLRQRGATEDALGPFMAHRAYLQVGISKLIAEVQKAFSEATDEPLSQVAKQFSDAAREVKGSIDTWRARQ